MKLKSVMLTAISRLGGNVESEPCRNSYALILKSVSGLAQRFDHVILCKLGGNRFTCLQKTGKPFRGAQNTHGSATDESP